MVSLVSGVSAGSARAATHSHASVQAASSQSGSVADILTKEQWHAMAAEARKNGDYRTARQATAFANGQGGFERVWWSIAKKAVVYMLRHGASKLPSSLRPYASKAANVLENMDKFEEAALTLGLAKAGIPPDVANDMAKAIAALI